LGTKKISPVFGYQLTELKKDINSNNPFLVVVSSDWCPACQEYKPVLEFYAEKYENKVNIYIIHTELLDESLDEVLKAQINAIPTTFFFLGSTKIAEVPGAISFKNFRSAISSLSSFRLKTSESKHES
jgi:thiol-disulfide isomerase/thioredoxin